MDMDEIVRFEKMAPAQADGRDDAELQQAEEISDFAFFVLADALLNSKKIYICEFFRVRLVRPGLERQNIYRVPACGERLGVTHDAIVRLVKRIREHADPLARDALECGMTLAISGHLARQCRPKRALITSLQVFKELSIVGDRIFTTRALR